jgi:hypothetical protein
MKYTETLDAATRRITNGTLNARQLQTMTGKSHQTLSNWMRSTPRFFEIVARGAMGVRHEAE